MAMLRGLCTAVAFGLGVGAFGWPASAATITVTNDSGVGSLRFAINAASSGDTIAFTPGLTGTITLASELPVITKNLTIDGSAGSIIVSGNNTYRPFLIGDAGTTASTYTVTIANITIANGKAQGGSGIDGGGGGAGLGGAVFVSSNGALTLTNVTLSANQAAGGTGGVVVSTGGGGGGGMGGNGGSDPTSQGNGGGGLLVGTNSVSGPGTNGGGANGGAGTGFAGAPLSEPLVVSVAAAGAHVR